MYVCMYVCITLSPFVYIYIYIYVYIYIICMCVYMHSHVCWSPFACPPVHRASDGVYVVCTAIHPWKGCRI